MGTLLLTSDSFANKNIEEKFKQLTEGKRNKVAIITTAAKDKEQNKYPQLSYDQMQSFGFKEVIFTDFERDSGVDLSNYDVLYVCGGNTFQLLKYAQKANFGDAIRAVLEKGGVYMGVSAGSLIVGPSIQIANEVKPDINEVGLENFTGFNITEHVIFPHYNPEYESDIETFENKNRVKVTRLKNGEALLISETQEVIIS